MEIFNILWGPKLVFLVFLLNVYHINKYLKQKLENLIMWGIYLVIYIFSYYIESKFIKCSQNIPM